MNFAEKKLELYKLVAEADEETTGKLIELAHILKTGNVTFSNDDIELFYKRRDDFFASGAKGYTADESLARLKKHLK